MIYAVNESKVHRVIERPSHARYGEIVIQADADGWIEWKAVSGEGQPLPYDCCYEAKYEDGKIQGFANHWDDSPEPGRRVAAYRPILNAEETEMKQEWSGEGLPPVGTECDCSHRGSEQGKVTVLYMGSQFCVLLNHGHGEEQCGPIGSYEFNPTLTDRDRWIEAALIECTDHISHRQLGKIYDAGLANLPEQTK